MFHLELEFGVLWVAMAPFGKLCNGNGYLGLIQPMDIDNKQSLGTNPDFEYGNDYLSMF